MKERKRAKYQSKSKRKPVRTMKILNHAQTLVGGIAVGVLFVYFTAVYEPPREPEPEPIALGGWEAEIQTEKVFYSFPISGEDYVITSPYGARVSPFLNIVRKHGGVDIVPPVPRAQTVAVADGIITEVWPPKGTPHPNGGFYKGHDIYGGLVVIDHGNGIVSRYGHMSWIDVREEQTIVAGSVLGRVGNTGMSTAEHLHFELEINGVLVNPMLYLDQVLPIEFLESLPSQEQEAG